MLFMEVRHFQSAWWLQTSRPLELERYMTIGPGQLGGLDVEDPGLNPGRAGSAHPGAKEELNAYTAVSKG